MHSSADSSDAYFSPTATPTFIASLIESAVRLFEVDRTASRECLHRAYALIRAQSKQSRDPAPDRTRGRLATWQVNRVMAHIDAHLTSALLAEDLANLVNLSVSHFFRAFKVSVGIPPREYITRRRIDLACELMTTTDEPLSQVALGCGLNDQSSLCRVFRRVVGQSPNEWRRVNSTGPRLHSVQERQQGTQQSVGSSGASAL